MAIRLGMRGVVNYKVGGVAAVGEWTALPIVRDVTLTIETGEADATTRGNNGWRATVGTLLDASVEFDMIHDPTNAGYIALRDAILERQPIGLQVLDEDDGEGLQADCMILNFSRGEPLEENMTISVSAKPTLSDTPPEWIEPEEVMALSSAAAPPLAISGADAKVAEFEERFSALLREFRDLSAPAPAPAPAPASEDPAPSDGESPATERDPDASKPDGEAAPDEIS